MAILLVAEHDNSSLSDQTAKALSAAAKIGGDVDILVAGKGAKPVADAAAKLSGVRKVLLAESDALAERLAEPLADTIVKLAAWKLALHGVPASGSVTINGVTLNRIFGHRDAGYTACPGQHLYADLLK
jgi:electron transfer flavoprotein alpha subunit